MSIPAIEISRSASLIESMHQPRQATVEACLDRWSGLDGAARARCYLVVQGDEPEERITLNSRQIEQLAKTLRLAA